MTPHRRDFLRAILTATVGMTLDVEKLLWKPGEKMILLPPVKSLHAVTTRQMAYILAELETIPRMPQRMAQNYARQLHAYEAMAGITPVLKGPRT